MVAERVVAPVGGGARVGALTQTYTTADIGEAQAFMSTVFMGHVPRVSGPRDAFRLRVASTDHGLFSRYQLAHRSTVESNADPYDGFLIGRVRRGRSRIRFGRDDVRLAAGGLYLYPRGTELLTTWNGVDVDSVILSPAVVGEAAAELGLGPVVVDAVQPESAELAAQWSRTVDYVDAVSATMPLEAYPLIAHQLARLLASMLLTTFPVRPIPVVPRPGRVTSLALRRAMAYVEEHADEPVTLVQLADAARVSPRALQQAFRRQLDVSPVEYARRVRLERAHHDLVRGDPTRGDTVAHIAARWGFVHLGRFAADHHGAYGASPRATLHG